MNKSDRKRIKAIFKEKIDMNLHIVGHLSFDKICACDDEEANKIQEQIEQEFYETCMLNRLMDEILGE